MLPLDGESRSAFGDKLMYSDGEIGIESRGRIKYKGLKKLLEGNSDLMVFMNDHSHIIASLPSNQGLPILHSESHCASVNTEYYHLQYNSYFDNSGRNQENRIGYSSSIGCCPRRISQNFYLFLEAIFCKIHIFN